MSHKSQRSVRSPRRRSHPDTSPPPAVPANGHPDVAIGSEPAHNGLRSDRVGGLGLVALVSSGQYALWLYPTSQTAAAIPLGLAGFAVLAGSMIGATTGCRLPPSRIHSRSLLRSRLLLTLFGVVPLALGVLQVIPWMVGIAAALTGLITFGPAAKRVRPATTDDVISQRTTAAWFTGLLITVGYLTVRIWPIIAARRLAFPAGIGAALAELEQSAQMLATATGLGGLSYHEIGNSAVFQTRSQHLALAGGARQPVNFVVTTEHLHLLLFVLLLGFSMLRSLLLVSQAKWSSLLKDLAAVLATFGVYLTATWLGLLAGDIPEGLWVVRVWSAICVVALWGIFRAAFERPSPVPQPIIHLRIPRLASLPGLCSALTVCLGVLLLWHDPGARKPGRIVIDEFHSEWEKADLPMVKDMFGVKTVYNYGFLKELLEKHFQSVRTSSASITPQLLAETDVLILKTPTQPYAPEEIAAIRRFVETGGGVWLIGDHTNIFGMNTYLNQVGSQWGIFFHADAVSPLPGFYQQIVSVAGVPPVHECGNREHETLSSAPYMNHPIVGHRIPFLAVLTSCSVSAPWDSSPISISRGTYVDHPRFGSNTFFGNMKYDAEEPYGCVLQNVAVQSGQGRLATWSDSTLFSNFSMCMTGVPELALGYVEWLNHRNLVPRHVTSAAALAVLIGLAGAVAAGRRRFRELTGSFVAGVILVGALVPVFDRMNSAACVVENAAQGFRTLGFDQQYSSLDLPNRDHVHRADIKNMESLYVLTQRLHLFPKAADRLSELTSCDAILLCNPRRNLAAEDVQRLRAFLANGGNLILLTGRTSGAAPPLAARIRSLNKLLEELDRPERFAVTPEAAITDFHGPLLQPALLTDADALAHIKIANPEATVLLQTAEGLPLLARCPAGRGTILLGTTSELFSNANLGEPGSVPNPRQELALQAATRLISEVVPWNQDQEELQRPWETLRKRLNAQEATTQVTPRATMPGSKAPL